MKKMRILGKEFNKEDAFELLADHLPDMIHAIDKDGDIIYANRAAEALLGYTQDELLTMNVLDVYPKALRQAVDEGFDALMKTGYKCGKSTILAKNGTEIPVQLSSFAVYDEDSNFVQDFSVFHDLR